MMHDACVWCMSGMHECDECERENNGFWDALCVMLYSLQHLQRKRFEFHCHKGSLLDISNEELGFLTRHTLPYLTNIEATSGSKLLKRKMAALRCCIYCYL